MELPGSFETGKSSGNFFISSLLEKKSSHQTSASYMPRSNIFIFTKFENHSKWKFQINVHFIDISIINFLYLKEKNFILAVQINYEIYNDKRVTSIYIKITDDCIELIQDCFDTTIIIAKFRSQFANKRWHAK